MAMNEPRPQLYLLGEFNLDAGRRQLSRHGEPVHLTPRPFQVLLYLIENRARLVSRGELLDRFWSGRDVYDVALTKSIGAIRKALDDRQEPPRFIETRYGEGYRFIGPVVEQPMPAAPGEPPTEREAGRESSEPASPPLPPPAHKAHRASLAVTLVTALTAIVLGVASFAFYRGRARTNEPAPAPPRSIAVLPLKNLSGDAAREYFSDGLTEILINELSKVRELKVISRSSVFTFKGREPDPREVGRRLGVAAVLEGGVRQEAGTVRVMVRLVSVEDGRVLWTGDSQTRALGEIVTVQDELGCSVAESLKAILCRDPQHRPGTSNLVAYDAYLKARDRRLKGDPKAAAELYRQAVAADPNYALAWAGLAEAYTVLEANSQVPPRSLTARARECAFKAIALDATLAAPYAALGLLAAFSDRDWAGGERFFKQGLALNSNYALGHAWYAGTLLAQGKFAAAEAEYLRAQELDPLHSGIANNLAETYYYWRQPERCLKQVEKVLELSPGNRWGYQNQARCYLMLGRHEDAWQSAQQTEHVQGWNAIKLAWAGREAEARQAAASLARSEFGQASPYGIAEMYALMGDREAAFAWLQKAAAAQQADLVSLKIAPVFDAMRSDPRFTALVRGLGLEP